METEAVLSAIRSLDVDAETKFVCTQAILQFMRTYKHDTREPTICKCGKPITVFNGEVCDFGRELEIVTASGSVVGGIHELVVKNNLGLHSGLKKHKCS